MAYHRGELFSLLFFPVEYLQHLKAINMSSKEDSLKITDNYISFHLSISRAKYVNSLKIQQ